MLGSLSLRLFAAMIVAILLVFALAWRLSDASAAHAVGGALGASLALAVVLAAVLSGLLARWVSQPIARMTASADRLAAGDLSVRLRDRNDDEIGALARALDRMADALDERFGRVRDGEARLRAMLDAMVEAVLVTDRDGRIVLSNAAFARLSPGDPLGRTVMEALRSPELHAAVERAASGIPGQTQFEIPGPRVTRSLRATVSSLPEKKGVIVVLHDVTELERATAIRRDFVANASHELRTPLTSIRGFAETLRDGALEDPQIARRFVHGITDNAVRLSRLVDDLLELSRSESPNVRYELEPVSIREVATKVLRSLEPQAIEKQVTLSLEEVGEPVWARAELQALEHILVNLVDNGIKYTQAGGAVTVQISRDDEHARFTVSDNGRGIEREHLPRIFERFYRVDPGRARVQGGSGLGLAIVKHLVLKMDGEVRVESRMGEGTRFDVSLPLVEPTDDLDESC